MWSTYYYYYFLQKLLLVMSEKANYVHITRFELMRHLRIISLDDEPLPRSQKPN